MLRGYRLVSRSFLPVTPVHIVVFLEPSLELLETVRVEVREFSKEFGCSEPRHRKLFEYFVSEMVGLNTVTRFLYIA